MVWHDIRDPNDPELDRLAVQHRLHPLHIEDCRHRNQSAKFEVQENYLFIVLKPIDMNEECEVEVSDVDFFIGADFLITVQEQHCDSLQTILDRYQGRSNGLRPDQMFHRLMDGLVDSYTPTLDRIRQRIDELEDEVLESAEAPLLQKVFAMKRALIEIRRVLTNTRDVASHAQRNESGLIQRDLSPFLRDVYDHVARSIDTLEIQRDLLNGIFDLYLNGVANRTNATMKALTVVSTISLPAIVISGAYGMNVKHLPMADHPWAAQIVMGIIGFCCVALILFFRRMKWL